MRATSPSGTLEVQMIYISVYNIIFVSKETCMLKKKKKKERNPLSLYQELNDYGIMFNWIFSFEIA